MLVPHNIDIYVIVFAWHILPWIVLHPPFYFCIIRLVFKMQQNIFVLEAYIINVLSTFQIPYFKFLLILALLKSSFLDCVSRFRKHSTLIIKMDQILKTEMSASSPKLSECISFLKCTYTILPCIKIVCVTLPELAFGF